MSCVNSYKSNYWHHAKTYLYSQQHVSFTSGTLQVVTVDVMCSIFHNVDLNLSQLGSLEDYCVTFFQLYINDRTEIFTYQTHVFNA